MNIHRRLRNLEKNIIQKQKEALTNKEYKVFQALQEIRKELDEIAVDASWEEYPESMGG